MIEDTLQNTLLQKAAWLQRLKPETLTVVETQLLIAQKNILEFIATTENRAKIATFVNQEVKNALETFETVLNDDIAEISDLSYVVAGVVMKDYVSDALSESFKGWKSIDSKVKDKLLSKDRLILGNLMSKHKQNLLLKANMRLNKAINEGFKEKTGIQQIAANIKNSFGMSINEAKTLSTTAIFQAINEAQFEAMDFFEDEILLYRYDGVSDSRQSSYCRLRTGKTSKVKEDITRLLNAHYRCRSTLGVETAMSREFDKMYPKKKLVEWEDKWVNHRDGTRSRKFKVDDVRTINKNSTPKQVFDSFNDEYQKEYLGKYRYNLYKSGKVSFEAVHNSAKDALMPIADLKRKLKL